VIVPEQDSGARLDLCPDDIAADIERVRSQPVRKDRYRLSVRRLAVAMNSHYRNGAYAKKKFPQNFAYMNPDDMLAEGLVDGSRIDISTSDGAIIGVVRADPTVRPGVVSMTHCFGAPDPADDPEAESGSHTGRLIPLDPTRAESINFMPHKTGIPVSISLRVPAARGKEHREHAHA
jgi:anaerobic selenocysteine-containing dehydrogenase